MAAIYTYVACDLVTNVVLNELPLHGVTFDRQINKPGNFQGSSSLDNERLDNASLLAATTPGRTALYVYRDDQIVWGGIIWSRWYQSQGKSLQFSAQTWESYAYKRIYRGGQVTLNEAQCQQIQTLWNDLQLNYAYGAIGVYGADTFPSGDVVRSIEYKPWDFKTHGAYIDDICDNFDDSPEFTIENYVDSNGDPRKQLVFGYPRLGSIAAFTNLVIDYPGNVLNYYWTESASDGVTQAWATGDGDESAVVYGVATDTASLTSGYPLLENVYNHSGVTVQATIDNRAANDLSSNPMPKITHQFDLKADEQPTFGTYALGDDARVQIIDPRFPDGMDTVVRVVGWSVTPPESDNTESVSLTLQEDTNAGAI